MPNKIKPPFILGVVIFNKLMFQNEKISSTFYINNLIIKQKNPLIKGLVKEHFQKSFIYIKTDFQFLPDLLIFYQF